MEKQINSKFKNGKVFLFSIFLFIFIFNFIQPVSAVATIDDLPDWVMPYSSTYLLDVTDYATNAQPSSTRLSFINPDTGSTITLLAGGSHSNSYFNAEVTSGNFVGIFSKGKSLFEHDFEVIVCDIPSSSCFPEVSDEFELTISSQVPLRISSVGNANLSANHFQSFDLEDLFKEGSYDRITLTYTDNVQAQAVSLEVEWDDDDEDCFIGGITACLEVSSFNNFFLDFEWVEDNNFNAVMTLTAHNDYYSLSTAMPSFSVFTIGEGAPVTPGQIPTRLPVSFSNLNLNYDDTEIFTIADYWANYSYVTAYVYNTSSSANVTITSYIGQINNTAFPEFNLSFGSGITKPLTISSFSSNYSYPIFFDVCNENGCNTTDAFGNRNQVLLNISATPPTRLPVSIGQLNIDFNSQSSYNFDVAFQNYEWLEISFLDPDTQQLTNLTSETGQVNFEHDYFNLLLGDNFVTVYSMNTSLEFNVYVSACNPAGCVSTDTFGNPNILKVVITRTGISGGNSETVNNWVSSFVGLFPDAEDLSLGQKVAFVVIILVFINIVLISISFAYGSGVPPVMGYLIAFIDVMLLIFFTAIGYIGIGIIILIALLLIAVGYFKFFGSNK